MLEMLKNVIRNKDVRNYFFRNFIKDNYKILDLGCSKGNTGLFIKKLHLNVEYNGCDVLYLNESITKILFINKLILMKVVFLTRMNTLML